jgi:hypothetical protein
MTDRTPEQHMADVAAYTLQRLSRLHDELDALGGQLSMLSDWAAEHQPHLPHEWLGDVADTIDQLGCCVPELVREISATLPTRHRHGWDTSPALKIGHRTAQPARRGRK